MASTGRLLKTYTNLAQKILPNFTCDQWNKSLPFAPILSEMHHILDSITFYQVIHGVRSFDMSKLILQIFWGANCEIMFGTKFWRITHILYVSRYGLYRQTHIEIRIVSWPCSIVKPLITVRCRGDIYGKPYGFLLISWYRQLLPDIGRSFPDIWNLNFWLCDMSVCDITPTVILIVPI